MKTDPQFQCRNSTSGRLMAVGASDNGFVHFINYLDANNSASLFLDTETYNINSCLRLVRKVNDVRSEYNLYGTHNITKGTSSLISGTSVLDTNAIYVQYE